MTDPQSCIPEVVDEDIEWVCRVMGLRDFDQYRQEFLRSQRTLDVSACPGSGKTTLIVAKLAIMARKWPYRTKGICVLSHTNAAREEIQRRLRGTVVGQHLLSYPHFIDTIHGFVNRFLALPWLNSNGFPCATVDDDVTSAYRRRILTDSDYWTVESYLRRKNNAFANIRLKDRDLNIEFPAQLSANSHQIAKRAVEASSRAGYFCFNEMFIWAKALLDDCSSVPKCLQRRFPMVIIDEMQDTSGLQSEIVESVFPRSSPDVMVQRVGDPNQAIFDGDRSGTVALRGFPDAATCLEIPNSFRFGPAIAALASPFAINSVGSDGLDGVGPSLVEGAPESCSNALFIFENGEAGRVLNAFGQYVLSSFSDDALSAGDVTALGAVHQEAGDVCVGHAHFPKTVPHYWRGYTAEVACRDPHPRTLIQYVRVAQALAEAAGDLAPGVDKIASGLVRLAGGAQILGRRAPKHRALVEAFETRPELKSAYRRLVQAFLLDGEGLDAGSWEQLQPDILRVASGLRGSPTVQDDFLSWVDDNPSHVTPAVASQRAVGQNICSVIDDAGRCVNIRLGSVHSMKGQTHLATLLLSTFWHDHSAKKILPWLMGDRMNLNGAGARDRVRLQQTYVAMTRPSHLLCLAIPDSVLGDAATRQDNVSKLRTRGWRVANVVEGASRWLE